MMTDLLSTRSPVPVSTPLPPVIQVEDAALSWVGAGSASMFNWASSRGNSSLSLAPMAQASLPCSKPFWG